MVDLNARDLTAADLPDRFRRFAALEAADASPLYAAMAEVAADLPVALALAGLRDPAQPPATLLFAAIHLLLQAGDDHPLRAYFPSVVDGACDPAQVGPALDSFLTDRAEALAPLMRRGRVATNEPARAAALMLALSVGVDLVGGARALALIDAGASAGLTLYPDRMQIDYGGGRRAGPAFAPLKVALRLDPPEAPPPADLPPVVRRIGVDLRPMRADDPADAAWLRALIWPEQKERFGRLETALALARAEPPELVTADAASVIGELAGDCAEDALVCVTHCMTLHQWAEPTRRLFHEQLKAASLRRPILRASFEQRPADPLPTLHLSVYVRGAQDRRVALAAADPHCSWIALNA